MKNCDPFFPAQNFIFKFCGVNLNFQNKDLALLSSELCVYQILYLESKLDFRVNRQIGLGVRCLRNTHQIVFLDSFLKFEDF